MGRVVILTEKPSAAKNFAKALGGGSGTYDGTDYKIVNALGHLLEFKQPAEMVPADLVEKYRSWEVSNLPWSPADLSWEYEPRKKNGKADPGVTSLIKELEAEFAAAEEISIAADIDPTGEGDLLAWEIIDYLGMHHKRFTRMEFLDEAPKSIQKAFVDRRPVKSMMDEGGYRKAYFRSRWDLLSMQFTRVASKVSGSQVVLRNGRLKSAMVVLVGDGLEAHNNYVKKPFFENRFRDENGVVYTDPDADRFENEADVPTGLASSPVVHEGTTRKKSSPPKLLDLSGLSALLSKRGFAAKNVLSTYQKMYEALYVSYPRTEDSFVSDEQFKELLPLVDDIARVVGVDPAMLSHRSPRKTHVKNGGAHGANRPGTNVPASLDEIEKKFGTLGRVIYEVLAKNYLTMLAPDYEYDQHKGHVQDHPDYKGTLNVPAVMGWKGVFVIEDEEQDPEGSPEATSLGSTAEPFVHQGYPPRPPHPSMTWLMKQLEKRSVGTGATRTSTYAEVTNNATGKALMIEGKGGKLTLSGPGELNHKVVSGTNIGDLGLTERVFDQMKQIEKQGADPEAFLAEVASLVSADIVTMTDNAGKLPADLMDKLGSAGVFRKAVEYIELPENLHFTAEGKTVTRAKREFSGHRFTDAEVAALCRGEEVTITATSARTGNQFTAPGRLEGRVVEFKGKKYPVVGFVPNFPEREKVGGRFKGGRQVEFNATWGANDHWEGHRFSQTEIKMLLAGEEIRFDAVSKNNKPYKAVGRLGESTYNGNKVFGFQLSPREGKSGGGKSSGGRSRRR